MEDNIFFTIINPDEPEEETKFNIYYKKLNVNGYAIINGIIIGPQQLAELGYLLYSVAHKLDNVIDNDSIIELLDGFNINIPRSLEN